MKKLIVLFVLIAIALPAVAVEDKEVAYVGGTAPNVKAGTIGRLDTAQETALVFEHGGGKFAIPYAKIESFNYSEERARRLGVLPFVATGLFKRMQRQHFVRITYRDGGETSGSVVFEIPKHMPKPLMAVLQARAPQACPLSASAYLPPTRYALDELAAGKTVNAWGLRAR